MKINNHINQVLVLELETYNLQVTKWPILTDRDGATQSRCRPWDISSDLRYSLSELLGLED